MVKGTQKCSSHLISCLLVILWLKYSGMADNAWTLHLQHYHVPLQHLPANATMQLPSSMLQVHPKTTGLHCIHLSTPFPCKRNLSKDTFFFGYNYHVAEGNGRPSIICQQQGNGGGAKKKKAKNKKRISLSNMALETS